MTSKPLYLVSGILIGAGFIGAAFGTAPAWVLAIMSGLGALVSAYIVDANT